MLGESLYEAGRFSIVLGEFQRREVEFSLVGGRMLCWGHLECSGGRVPCSLVEFACCGRITQLWDDFPLISERIYFSWAHP